MTRWYVVMLPGESAALSELYGPFRSEALATVAGGDQAEVLPIPSAAELREAL
jgi:hypothetical protein